MYLVFLVLFGVYNLLYYKYNTWFTSVKDFIRNLARNPDDKLINDK